MLNYEPKLIKSEKDYKEALDSLDKLMEQDELNESERNALELLAHLIEEYEDKQFPTSLPDPIEAIKFRMEQAGLKQKDLIPFLGDKSQASLVLNKKKPLTLSMVRALHDGLDIPLESLVANEQKKLVPEIANIDWNKFPIAAMYKQNRDIYFPNIQKTVRDLKNNVEANIRYLFEPYSDILFSHSLLRQNPCLSTKCDNYALIAWLDAVCRLADQNESPVRFNIKRQALILNQLRVLSTFDEGPKLAKEFLEKIGIKLIILKHLPKTYLDGVAFNLRENEPVIGLTLRYDRIDNFWFTLFHELGHIFLHHVENNNPIFDNLELHVDTETENAANDFAANNLIADEELIEAGLFDDYNYDKIVEVAVKKQIHPAIIAGRIRKRLNNYYILKRLVGFGEVRKQFDS
ncbi:MAG TPA: ImmA/IrrE family metallo-endopeptidase [Candidatus Cloacimonadota bacterium]|nr:ImmA/IrrE family metallo-endopeptidase [Candidatus Cloacimonadota bacterium]